MKELINGLKKWRSILKFEATDNFNDNYNREICWVLSKVNNKRQQNTKEIKEIDEDNVYLKISIVLAVTHLSVFVEKITKEFVSKVFDDVKFVELNSDMQNTHKEILKQDLKNICDKIPKNIDNDIRDSIIEGIQSLKIEIDKYYKREVGGGDFKFKSQLTLGQKRKEIIDIFSQFDKSFPKYLNDKEKDFSLSLDSALQVRHSIVHMNKLPTFEDAKKNCEVIKRFVEYVDDIMDSILQKIKSNGVGIERQ